MIEMLVMGLIFSVVGVIGYGVTVNVIAEVFA
mgnify:CR=1 FL=1